MVRFLPVPVGAMIENNVNSVAAVASETNSKTAAGAAAAGSATTTDSETILRKEFFADRVLLVPNSVGFILALNYLCLWLWIMAADNLSMDPESGNSVSGPKHTLSSISASLHRLWSAERSEGSRIREFFM